MAPTEPLIFVLHGARGDLAQRMVLPALATLQRRGLLPEHWALLGTGRTPISSKEFDELLRAAVEEFGDEEAAEGVPELTKHTAYCGDVTEDGSADELPGELERLQGVLGGGATVIHYLAVPPSSFAPITRALDKAGLTDGVRVVYEKPYGTSLETFRDLDAIVHAAFDEEQVFRIDHFLGKEATQNLHVLRFANELFGGVWNRRHVEQVQIDVPETLDVAQRAEFYDATGAALDMLVTHLFQVAAEVAMEPPRKLDAANLGKAREDVIAHFRPLDPANDVVLGQFEGYRDIEGVPDDSTTDTFVAARLWVDTERWEGVPFLLRTGKRMAGSAQQVTLVLRTPDELFGSPVGPNRVVVSLAGSGELKVDDDRQEARRVPRARDRDGQPGAGRRRAGRVPAAVRRAAGGRARRRPHPVHHGRRAGGRLDRVRPAARRRAARRPSRTRSGSWGPESADRLAEPHGWVLGD